MEGSDQVRKRINKGGWKYKVEPRKGMLEKERLFKVSFSL